MVKKIKQGLQWHIVLLSVILLLFSFLCWLGFARRMGSLLIKSFMASGAVEETVDEERDRDKGDSLKKAEPASQAKPNRIEKGLGFIDSAVAQIDSKWYSNVYKRSSLSKWDSYITYHVTGEIASSQVLLGSENWLFYKTTTDGDPIADYEGTNPYSADEMEAFLGSARRVQEELTNRGIRFAMVVAPNKENIYAEYMPDSYSHAEVSSTDALIEYLLDGGIQIVSPKQELLSNRNVYPLYYSYDSHWNQLGAYIGVKKVLESWNIQMPDLSECTISTKELREEYHSAGNDDLARMLGLLSVFNDEIEYAIDGTDMPDWAGFSREQNNEQVSHYLNPNAKIDGSVLLVGDSFRVSMIPALKSMYAEVYVLHRTYYKSELLDEINPDYVIAEFVERYSDDIEDMDVLIK